MAAHEPKHSGVFEVRKQTSHVDTKFASVTVVITSHGLITSSSILAALRRENCSTTSIVHKGFPRVHQVPKHGFLQYRNKQTFLIGKDVLCVVAILMTNDLSLVTMI